jgi:hypothetical protein
VSLPDDLMKELIHEAVQIVSGESMKLATKDHLRALLEERTNLVAGLSIAVDALDDVTSCYEWSPRHQMGMAGKEEVEIVRKEAEFLKRLDPNWELKVLHADE